jgi:hypothetical protein
VTYYCIDELSTPYFKIFFLSNVGIQEQFEKVEDDDLDLCKNEVILVEIECDCWKMEVDEKVVMCNEATMQ